MRIFDIIKQKYENARDLRVQRIEQKRLEHEAQVAREKERIQKILNSDIPWEYVVELECEYADENDEVCYLDKCIMCDVKRKDIWVNGEVNGVVISGDDFGKNITLNVGEDFYGKKQVSFWDNFDYMWYGYGNLQHLASKPFKTIRELNNYLNDYNKKRIDGISKDDNVNMQK